METNKKYNIIYADPPWKYQGEMIKGSNIARHYNCLSLEELKQLPINKLADENCILFLWVTMPKLNEAFPLLDAWGFKYKTVAFTWIKQNKKNSKYFVGLGRWTSSNAELCLLATKGSPHKYKSGIRQLIVSKRREHSRKPDEVRNRIVELMGDVPRIELFARQRFEGWDVWGNEAPEDIQTLIKDNGKK